MAFELWKTDHGMGGPYDSTTSLVAVFTTLAKAQLYLSKRGYTLLSGTRYSNGKGGLGSLDYEIREYSNKIDPE